VTRRFLMSLASANPNRTQHLIFGNVFRRQIGKRHLVRAMEQVIDNPQEPEKPVPAWRAFPSILF
jgi:hypothetical protein